uniref:Secreted protein n=1 Tax=Rhipicephalus pulchellus TaxID=72859 RepID=L7LZH4_RHIPC
MMRCLVCVNCTLTCSGLLVGPLCTICCCCCSACRTLICCSSWYSSCRVWGASGWFRICGLRCPACTAICICCTRRRSCVADGTFGWPRRAPMPAGPPAGPPPGKCCCCCCCWRIFCTRAGLRLLILFATVRLEFCPPIPVLLSRLAGALDPGLEPCGGLKPCPPP